MALREENAESALEHTDMPGLAMAKAPKGSPSFDDRADAMAENAPADEPRSTGGKTKNTVGDFVTESSDGEVSAARSRWTPSYIANIIDNCGVDGKLESAIKDEIDYIVSQNSALSDVSVIYLYDHVNINRLHASTIYQYLSSLSAKKDIYLILKSLGGEVEAAYLISKMCNRLKRAKFIIGIPAEAKSAATLLSLGGDEIHMGAMSELGPIDPQINDFPALAFSGALKKITELADRYPKAADMLAKYLGSSSLDVRSLGHYERITESSTQYAIRLLKSKATSTEDNISELEKLASHFTNHYKDHNFVIDIDEAQDLLSGDVVKADSEFYETCHEVHKFLETFEQVMAIKGCPKKIRVLGGRIFLATA